PYSDKMLASTPGKSRRILKSPEAEKIYSQQFFHNIKYSKEEHRVENKIDHKIYPTGHTGIIHNHIRERICDDNCTKNSKEKNNPFFDFDKIHTDYWRLHLLKLSKECQYIFFVGSCTLLLTSYAIGSLAYGRKVFDYPLPISQTVY